MEPGMITRDEAIAVLTELIESGILDEGLRDILDEIRINIHYERIGLHLWGACEKDFETDESIAKYMFGPSEFEEVAIMNERKKFDEEGATDAQSEDNAEVDKLPN